MHQVFSINESVRFGWHTLKVHSSLIYKVLFTLFALSIAAQVVAKVLTGPGAVLAGIVLFAAQVVVGVGMVRISLHLVRHEHTQYSDLVPPANIVLLYLGATIVAGIITAAPLLVAFLIWAVLFAAATPSATTVGVGAVLGIIAFVCCFYFSLRYSMVRYAIFDKHSVTSSLRRSALLTHGHKWHLVLLVLALIAVNIVGALALLVGLLVSIPVSIIAYAHVYDKLTQHTPHLG